ncbi:hypothetical protein [Streptomyces canus]|uniref:COG4705 family protein n=1 Tax=Streptomyces canus TaxID=58343 RepID=UPI0036E9C577
MAAGTQAVPSDRRPRWNKVPEVTAYFWIIKVLCTTVGETAADLLNEKAGLGLTGVSVLMSSLLAVVLVVQFRTSAYRAGVYWLAVALISVVGTLISDNLTDNMGVTLETSTTVFAIILAIVFLVWYRRERTLSIHSIDTTGRESYYWLAVLFTFALGTAAGDLVSERMDLGYRLAALLFALAIAAVALAHRTLGLDAVWSFSLVPQVPVHHGVEHHRQHGHQQRGRGQRHEGEPAAQGAGSRTVQDSVHDRRCPIPRAVVRLRPLPASRSLRRSRLRY